MNVIGHQAIRQHRHIRASAPLGDQLDVARIIGRFKKRLLPPVATLRDVVGDPGDDDASGSGHKGACSTRFGSKQEQNMFHDVRKIELSPFRASPSATVYVELRGAGG